MGFRRLASYLSCFAKKGNPKKATPEAPVATRLPCDARRNGPSRTRSAGLAAGFTQTCATEDSRPVCASRRAQRGPQPKQHGSLGCCTGQVALERQKPGGFRGPRGPAEKRRTLRGSRRALSESSQLKTVMTSCAGAEESEHHREVAQSATGTSGSPFLW